MNELAENSHRRTKFVVALVLSFAAGFVDIVGALTVYHLFTAHMTGTTVHLGEYIIQHNWSGAVAAIVIVTAFFLASLVGRVLIEAAQRARFKRIASITLAIEAALLLSIIVIGIRAQIGGHPETNAVPLVLIILTLFAGAMGLQTASLTKIGPLTVHTTFVTGMLNKLAQVVSLWMFATYDFHTHKRPDSEHLGKEITENACKARFLLTIWIVYLAGAACGTWFAKNAQLRALYLPCCILLAVIVIDQVRPLSIEEEQEQAE